MVGLDDLLEGTGPADRAAVGASLGRLIGGGDPGARLLGHEALKGSPRRVIRLRVSAGGQDRSVVIKHLSPAVAWRTEMVARRWLPALDLGEGGPPLIGSVAEAGGRHVWQVYEDLGPWELDPRAPDRERVKAAAALIARMHTRFAAHPLLGEVRLHGGDLGIHFYENSVRDALHALAGWRPAPADRRVRDHLVERVSRLLRELPARRKLLEALGGPETLLHGDLWPVNIFVCPGEGGPRSRLIDWDHAAVGPAAYDLSTLLLR